MSRSHRTFPAFLAVIALTSLAASAVVAADAAHGKAVFNSQCATCHTAAKGGPPILGPNLWGVVGRKAGAVPGFAYSSAMKASGLTWSEAELSAYLTAPQQVVKGAKMTYPGLRDPAKLSDLVAYLASLK